MNPMDLMRVNLNIRTSSSECAACDQLENCRHYGEAFTQDQLKRTSESLFGTKLLVFGSSTDRFQPFRFSELFGTLS